MAFYNFHWTPCVRFSGDNRLTTRVLTKEKNPLQFGGLLRSGESPKNPLNVKMRKMPKNIDFLQFLWDTLCLFFMT